MAAPNQTEPWPEFTPLPAAAEYPLGDTPTSANYDGHSHISSSIPSQNRQSRGKSLIHDILTGDTPLGVWQAIGEAGSKIPTLSEIHDGSFGEEGWSREGQLEHRGTDSHETHRRTSRAGGRFDFTGSEETKATGVALTFPEACVGTSQTEGTIDSGLSNHQQLQPKTHSATMPTMHTKSVNIVDITFPPEGPDEDGFYPNGYRFPEKHTWTQSTGIALKAFWKFFITLKGFLFTIYCLNVVGWGAMIFFVLLNAAPAMCHPSCNDKYSPRSVWIEIDAQVLTALFCVPAFGLIPRRFRDFYLLMRWRLGRDHASHRKLAGVYRSWYRLPGSNRLAPTVGPLPTGNKKQRGPEKSPELRSAETLQDLMDNPALPLPPQKIPNAPLTGVRAPPTKSWNLDIVIWMYMLNTWIQGALCGIMWGMNRFNRPSWATGFLITIGCITGIVGGVVEFTRGSKVKKVEGIPVKGEFDIERTEEYRNSKSKGDVRSATQQIRHIQTGGTPSQ